MPLKVENFLPDQIDASVTREITYAAADETVKYAALQSLGVLETIDVEHKWFHDGAEDYLTAINNVPDDYNAATTSLTVDDSSVFKPGDILIADATGERMYVSAVPSGTSITVVRGIGGSTAATGSVADNAVLRALGIAAGEGSDKPSSRNSVPTRHTNFTQIFKRVVEMTGTANAVRTNTPEARARQRMLAFRDLLREIERVLTFGVKADNLSDADGNRVRTMAGLYSFITSNVGNPGGALTKAWVRSWARDIFATGSTTKLLFAGGLVMEQLEGLYEDQIRFVNGETAYGMRLGRLETTHGELQIVTDRSLNGAYNGDGIVVDPAEVNIRALPGRELALRQNVQSNSEDRVCDQWLGEFTVEYGAEPNHARLEGVAA